MDSKVNVLISTYNGERYLREQMESVLNQSYRNIEIYVRDDGSTDETRKILTNYENINNVNIIYGDNIGYGKSFLTLLEIADQGEYWSFCDQDDVWFPDKIRTAVEWFENQEQEGPLLFHSAYYNTDEKLNKTDLIIKPKYKYNFVRAITECLHLGFSEVMNASLRQLVLKGDKNNLITHDWWTELIAMKFGTVEFDNEPMCLHRRLSNSVSVHSMSARVKWFKNAWKGNAEISSCAKEFERVFGQYIDDAECKINRWFCIDKYDFLKSLKKAFYYHRWRPIMSSEIVVRFLMLCGKI